MIALAVAAGGAAGALARYGLDGLVARRVRSPFPLGTLVINVSGSTALGALAGLVRGPALLALLATGFLGGYTTFSTFAYETLRLAEDGARRYGALNVLLSGPLSFAGAAAGWYLTRGV